MTATTLTYDLGDAGVTVTTGGTPGAKGIAIIIDHSKIDTSGDVYAAIRKCAEAYADAYPAPAS